MKKNYTTLILLFFITAYASAQDYFQGVELLNISEQNVNTPENKSPVAFFNTFPNPAVDFIRIDIDGHFNEIVLKAKTQEQYRLKADNKLVDVSTLPKGIYTIRVDTVDRIYYAKLFKR